MTWKYLLHYWSLFVGNPPLTYKRSVKHGSALKTCLLCICVNLVKPLCKQSSGWWWDLLTPMWCQCNVMVWNKWRKVLSIKTRAKKNRAASVRCTDPEAWYTVMNEIITATKQRLIGTNADLCGHIYSPFSYIFTQCDMHAQLSPCYCYSLFLFVYLKLKPVVWFDSMLINNQSYLIFDNLLCISAV